MKILVFGARGWIGSRFLEAWPDAVAADPSVRLEDKAGVLAEIDKHKPEAVLNATGALGNRNIDWCETHQMEAARGFVINPLILAEACQEKNLYLFHLATGSLFSGPSPDPRGWRESDNANPASSYTKAKYAADLVLSALPNVAIARFSMPIEALPSERNLITKLASFSEVTDAVNSVTIIPDLIDASRKLIERRATGIFHIVNPGAMRTSDLLTLYKEHVDPNHRVNWVNEDELLRLGKIQKKRPACVLQSERLLELGIELRPIDVALRDTMIKYASHVRKPQPTSTHSFLKQDYPMPQVPSMPKMKGLIVAGGKGTRLMPLTATTNKHLLPVANKQMVLYPLQTLLDAGIREIMIVTGPDHAGHFMNLLGSGAQFGCRLTYRIQDEAGGIAQAIGMAEDFVGNDHLTIILGDNLFEENFMAPISSFQGGGLIFYKAVPDAQRFGVLELDQMGRVISIEEKPQFPKSNFASVGLYVFDKRVFDIIKTLKPSARGELEVTDIHKGYLQMNELVARPVRGYWSDAGTFESLARANTYFGTKNQ